jgi:DNA-binding CsgD family transcriptional regulator
LAVVITLSLVFRLDDHIFIPVLVNSILTTYVTIPLWGYYLFDVDKKYFKNIPILVVLEAVIDNILIRYDLLNVLYILRIVFYILLTAPIFIKKKNKYEKDSIEGKMQKVTKITVTAFVIFMATLIPLSLLIFEISYVASLFMVISVLSFQIPGLVHCRNRLLKGELPGKTGISSLTKRENEIASAICSGYKYEEIAEKLHISISTVKTHSYAIYRKLGIKNNRELMQIFMENPENDTAGT